MNQVKTGAAYIRVSTDEQLELSPQSQLKEILSYADSHQIIIPEAFYFLEKEGRSGKKAGNRPEFQKMISMSKEKPRPFDVILVWKFSRFARNQDESTFYKSMLRKKLGIDIISVSEPILEGMYGRLIEMIIEWQDEFYSYNLGMEVTRGMKENALRGAYQSPPPLGYQYVGSGLPPAVVPDQARVVQFIFNQYVFSRSSFSTIAQMLNQQGLRTQRGGKFEGRSIRYILTNPFYTGMIRWNYTSHRRTDEALEDSPIISRGRHSPIIDDTLFNQAQKLIHDYKIPEKKQNLSSLSPSHYLAKFLFCNVCQSPLTCSKGENPGFQCWQYARGHHRPSMYLSVSKAETAFFSSVETVLGNLEKVSIEPSRITDSNLSCVHLALKQLEVRENRVREAFLSGIDTIEEYEKQKKELLTEKNRLTLLLENDSPITEKQLPKNICDFFKSSQVPATQKQQILGLILQRTVWDKENGVLSFYYYL